MKLDPILEARINEHISYATTSRYSEGVLETDSALSQYFYAALDLNEDHRVPCGYSRNYKLLLLQRAENLREAAEQQAAGVEVSKANPFQDPLPIPSACSPDVRMTIDREVASIQIPPDVLASFAILSDMFDEVFVSGLATAPHPSSNDALTAFLINYQKFLYAYICINDSRSALSVFRDAVNPVKELKAILPQLVSAQLIMHRPTRFRTDVGRLGMTRHFPSRFQDQVATEAIWGNGSSKVAKKKSSHRNDSLESKHPDVVDEVESESTINSSALPEFTNEILESLDGVLPDVVYRVAPALLRPHDDNEQLFAPVEGHEEQHAFEADVEEHGVTHVLVACGDGCASTKGTLLEGHRRWEAACKARLSSVRVEFRCDLDVHDERHLLIRGNLAAQYTRRLSEEACFVLEEEARRHLSKGQGARTDLSTYTDSDGSSKRDRETNQQIAKKLGTTRSSVRDRKTIFSSSIVSRDVKNAVNKGQLPRSKAAELVREAEKALGKAPESSQVEEARAKLDVRVLGVLDGQAAPLHQQAQPESTPPTADTAIRPPSPDDGYMPEKSILENAVEHIEQAINLMNDAAIRWSTAEYSSSIPPGHSEEMKSFVEVLRGLNTELLDRYIPDGTCSCAGADMDCKMCRGYGWLTRKSAKRNEPSEAPEADTSPP